MSTKNYILNKAVAEKKIRRMALEIIEQNSNEEELVLVGIADNGFTLAACVQKMVNEFSGIKTNLARFQIDKKNPKQYTLEKTNGYDDKVVIIIDDVSNSGRTLLYSLRPFLEFYPKKIQTLVLVERSHNDFPVRPDYVGLSVSTTLQEHIIVEVKEGAIMGAFMQ